MAVPGLAPASPCDPAADTSVQVDTPIEEDDRQPATGAQVDGTRSTVPLTRQQRAAQAPLRRR